MTVTTMADPIDHIRKHIDITSEMESSLRQMMSEAHFRRGQTKFSNHELRSLAFFIRKGSARSFYIHAGKEHTYSFTLDDDFITIPKAIANLVPDVTIGIEFMEPTEVVFIPIADMRTIINRYGHKHIAEVLSYMISVLFEHTQNIEEHMLVLQSLSATERYRWFTQKYPAILERASLTQIASFLGITKETLYRIRGGKYQSK